jgi:LPXTG-motif cell wall-anchored protein
VAGLADVATVDFPDSCEVTGAEAVCDVSGARFVELRLTPVDGAAEGDRGTITYEASASNIDPTGEATATVTIGAGTDLVNLLATEISDETRPGQEFTVPVRVYNAGDEAADGFDLVGVFTDGLRPVPTDGCEIGTIGELPFTAVRCRVDLAVPPGDDGEFVAVELPVKLAADAHAYEGVDVGVWPTGTGPDLGDRAMSAMRGPGLRAKTVSVRTAAQTPDIDEADNEGYFYLTHVVNAFDIAAIGGSASGKVGDTVTVTFGFENRAVGTHDSFADAKPLGVLFFPPRGTVADVVPGNCGEVVWGPDGTVYDILFGKAGGAMYMCVGFSPFERGDKATFAMGLRIVGPTAAGDLSLSEWGVNYPPQWQDDNGANDGAEVTVTVTSGGGGGGGEGELPITGTPVAALAIGGAVLLLLGGALVLLGRRRAAR